MILRLLSILLLAFTQSTWSQIINLNDCECGQRLRLQHILPDEGRLGSSELLPIRIGYFSDSNSSISFDGNTLIINEHLIKKEGKYFKQISYPTENESYRGNPFLNSVGDTIIFTAYDEISGNLLNYFNIYTQNIEIKYTPPYRRNEKFNADGNVLAFIAPNENSLNLNVIEYNKGNYKETLVVEDIGFSPGISHVSLNGDRIFYSAKMQQYYVPHKYYYVDRLETGWSEPKEINLLLDPFSNPHDFVLGYANNGRTLLVGNSDFETYYDIGLSYEIDGTWTKPVRIKNFPFENNTFKISENGKTIVRLFQKRFIPRYGGTFYDLYVYVQNESGEWKEYLVNEPEDETFLYILLSGDGTKLYWRLLGTSSIPEFEAYK